MVGVPRADFGVDRGMATRVMRISFLDNVRYELQLVFWECSRRPNSFLHTATIFLCYLLAAPIRPRQSFEASKLGFLRGLNTTPKGNENWLTTGPDNTTGT